MYGDIADNPLATLTRIHTEGEAKCHITTPSGIRHCQPKATVLNFTVRSNPHQEDYSLVIDIIIKESIDFNAFTHASTMDLS